VARIRLIHWNGPEGRERKQRLAALGHQAEFDDDEWPALGRTIRANLPDVYLIDLSRLPSHGREVALSLRGRKDTRHTPIVFVDGEPEKVARLKAILPDAIYTTWGRLKTAIPRAMARPPAAPVMPPTSIYAGRPTVEKLGVKAAMRVALVGAPPRFADSLKDLPPKVSFTAKPSSECDLFLVFVRSRRELEAQLVAVGRVAAKQTAWFAWPKKASGVATDLDGNIVRETGLSAGLVDFKVCSIDDTWSGLAFKRKGR
jgi:CheY-like chemotaxis protein